MKKIALTLSLLAIVVVCDAQWNLNGTSVYYNGGNVGINTTTPSNTQGWDRVLDVRGGTNAKIIATTDNEGYRAGIYAHSVWNGGGGIVGTETNHPLFFMTNYSTKMKLDVNGNLAIGHNTPYTHSRLHIKAGTGSPWGIMAEASTNGKVTAIGHDGNAGYVSVSYLDGSAYTPLFLRTSNLVRVAILADGNVGIGTANPDKTLTVNGTVHTKEVLVDLTVPGPDYVFEKDYDLLPLAELEAYINKNKHLPEVPSAKEMEANGLNLKEMNLLLLKKVEELTLHIIELEKRVKQIEK